MCTNNKGLMSLMLHTKLNQIGPVVPGKKIFKVFLPYMSMAAILIMSPA